MSPPTELEQIIELEKKTRSRYSNLMKLLFLFGLILVIWVFVVFVTVFFGGYDYTWTGASFEIWVYIFAVVVGIFILFEILLYTRFTNLKNVRIEKEKPKAEFLDGKRVYVYSHPEGMEGGVFSKTYVEIDERNILRLRTLMIDPGEIWKKVEKKSK
jgi:hypothetical protein